MKYNGCNHVSILWKESSLKCLTTFNPSKRSKKLTTFYSVYGAISTPYAMCFCFWLALTMNYGCPISLNWRNKTF